MTNPTDHFQAELAELYQRGAELCRQDSDFGYSIIVKAGMGRTLQECNGADHFP